MVHLDDVWGDLKCQGHRSNVSSQMTLTADEVISHKIYAANDIGMILGRFGPREVPHAGQ